MLPDGWRRVPLHKIAEIRTGLAKGKKELRAPVEIPYLRVANVQDGHFNLKEIKTIRVEKDAIERYALIEGDVLMTEGGDFDKLGRGAVWRAPIVPCLHQNHVFVVRPYAGQLDPDYLSALSGSAYGRNYFLSCAKRSTNLASINSSQLKVFPVLVPPYQEQREIAHALEIWTAAIDTEEKLLINTRKQKAAILRKLFNTYQTEHHLSFQKKAIGDLVCIHYGRSPNEIRSVQGPYPIIGTGGKVGSSAHYLVDAGAVIIGRKGSISSPRFVQGKFWPIDTTFYCLPKDGCNLKWFYHLVSNLNLEQYSEASGVPSLSRGTIESLRVKVPELDVQDQIAAILDVADHEIGLLEAQLVKLKIEKRALMRDLLTGKRRVRLSTIEEAVSA